MKLVCAVRPQRSDNMRGVLIWYEAFMQQRQRRFEHAWVGGGAGEQLLPLS